MKVENSEILEKKILTMIKFDRFFSNQELTNAKCHV